MLKILSYNAKNAHVQNLSVFIYDEKTYTVLYAQKNGQKPMETCVVYFSLEGFMQSSTSRKPTCLENNENEKLYSVCYRSRLYDVITSRFASGVSATAVNLVAELKI